MKIFLYTLFVFLHVGVTLRAEGLRDPNWHSGQLQNGLRYFIRANPKPENRVELRLVVNAGSILEEDDQQGLAHFLEHSAFNGTRNFEKNDLVGFLESLGIAFGADVNAYTSFDETVYKLKVPTEDPEVVRKAFLIMADWASGITNSDQALADERGVIIEEWRGRRGANARIRDQEFPVMFAGSRYADRLPIGKMEVLENFDFDRLRDFYRDWYRPDLISVVVVGDVDVANMEALILEYFSGMTGPENAPERKAFIHPEHVDTKVGTFSDPELTESEVSLLWKMPRTPVTTETEYVEDLKKSLISTMLNQRLYERSQQSQAPFLRGQAYQGSYTRGGDVFALFARVKDEKGAYVEAAKALLIEAERAQRFGFTQSELDRAVARQLRGMEKAYAERNRTESVKYASEMVRHALTGEYLPGIETELEVQRRELGRISLEELQMIYLDWIRDENRVIMASGPSHEGETNLPDDEELLGVYAEVDAMELTPYEDGISDQPFIEKAPEPGHILEKSYREDLGLTEYLLSNGVTVTLKITDFKEDEVLFTAWRAGGINLASEAEWNSARMAGAVASATGMGDFSVVDMQKKLSGKLVGVTAGFSMNQDEISGQASTRDLETLFQLIYLRMTTVHEDPNAFMALQTRLREQVRNRLSDPKALFGEMVRQTLNVYHPRMAPMTVEDVDALNMSEALAFFHERFQNAYGFNFLFIGNVEELRFEELMKKWVASLPSEEIDVETDFLDTGFPKYELRRDMFKGLEPISQVQMVWTQEDFTWNYASRHRIHSMVAALRIRLREVVREEEGGTYGVSIRAPMKHYPEPRAQIRIAFTCDPARTEDLIQKVEEVLDELRSEELDESYTQKVREGQIRRREQDLKENEYWNYVLPFYEWHGEDPEIILELDDYVEKVTPEQILETANQIFSTPHRSVFVLHPETGTPEIESP